jgi:hypothetical protein
MSTSHTAYHIIAWNQEKNEEHVVWHSTRTFHIIRKCSRLHLCCWFLFYSKI